MSIRSPSLLSVPAASALQYHVQSSCSDRNGLRESSIETSVSYSCIESCGSTSPSSNFHTLINPSSPAVANQSSQPFHRESVSPSVISASSPSSPPSSDRSVAAAFDGESVHHLIVLISDRPCASSKVARSVKIGGAEDSELVGRV